MNRNLRTSASLFALIAVTSAAHAASVSVTVQRVPPPIEVVNDGVPADALIHKFFVTTDADILAIDRVGITATTLFHVPPPFGSNTEPGDPIFTALVPSLGADTWITTPGPTSLLGPDLPGDGSLTTFGDLTNDGPQTNFQFAQLTAAPENDLLVFNYRIQVAGSIGPEAFEFTYLWPIPEPASLALASLGLLGVAAVYRRGRNRPIS